MLKQIVSILCLLISTLATADSAPPEFKVESVYNGVWVNKGTYIYKTIGHRGEDEFISSLCRDISFYPVISKSGNEYSAINYKFELTNGGITLTISSKHTCLPSGKYQRLK